MDINVGDRYYCIAESDESHRHTRSIQKQKDRRPHEVEVVSLDPVYVAHVVSSGQLNKDTNSSSHFYSGDPKEYLFETETAAWRAYIQNQRERAKKKRDEADRIDKTANLLERALEQEDQDTKFTHMTGRLKNYD